MKIGDVVSKVPNMYGPTGFSYGIPEKEQKGQVVYIHPKNRFYIVEFKTQKGSFKESFYD